MKRRSAGPLLPFAWARQHGVLAVDGQSGIQMYCHPETSHAGLMEAYRCLPGEPALARLEVEAFDQRLVAHYQQESGQAQKMIDDLGGELDFYALAEELPLKSVVLNHKREVAVSMLLTWLLSAGIVVVILMTPTYLQKQFGIAPALTLQANSIATIMLIAGCIVAGLSADRFGASKTLVVGSVLLAGCSWLFYQTVGVRPEMLFACYALVGFSVGVVGAVPYVMVRAFPAEVRFTGISFSYNVSYAIFGGLTPIFVTLIMKLTPLAPAYYVLALSLIGLLLGVYLHRDLNSEAGERQADSYS